MKAKELATKLLENPDYVVVIPSEKCGFEEAQYVYALKIVHQDGIYTDYMELWDTLEARDPSKLKTVMVIS